ncbi:MAG: LytTR family DNA-binding domain-containing protein [Ginsengibacter sp.]
MIKAIIIEDEIRAMDVMYQTLQKVSIEINVQAKLRSVKESIQYLKKETEADIIFCDVQLSDGLSFEIFKNVRINIPVVFTTAFDQYLLLAFENNGIDYLLKPVQKSDVEKALTKFCKLKQHFQQSTGESLVQKLESIGTAKKRTRIIVKRGNENVILRLDDVILFCTEDKEVFAIDRFHKKYLIDKNLSQLAEELDGGQFFRANRKFIINLDYVRGYEPFEKVKLLIDLEMSVAEHKIIISQETAPHFRNWMRSA